MAELTSKKASYVARLVQRCGAVLDALDGLATLRREWAELGYGGGDQPEPPPTAITDADLGNTPHLTAADLGNVMSSIDAAGALRSQGHGTNLQKLRP